ncbi:uroporphyrinogen decarboxylase family protein [Enterorhabdus sp. P55]|uniref:uroporphyrinogen decarboxylase family protein n=1 Tax=Enterorhabdus sp. P55 TaxID=2304571 RepID=UPI001F3550C4|nr:uroporphyrinogen decarboxylase family protein [Enterorhabdus sp. P55]
MEMTPRENMMAILEGRQPEWYGDFQSAVEIMMDPIWKSDSVPRDGLEHKDSWGTVCVFPPDAPGKHPHVTPDNAVVTDITKWREQLTIPSLDGLDWSEAEARAAQVDRGERFVEYFSAQGLFERSHFLMGMEEAFCAYLEEPEAMFEMLTAIADYKKRAIKEAARRLKPDVIFFQDDWGSKQNLFLPPDTWREMIKPLQTEIAQVIHECGMIYVHHADCICEPIAEDMVDIGIDIWQGVIPQNDIVAIQEKTGGRLAMIGGIDGPAIDNPDTPEEAIVAEVRRCVDTYCPAGRFFPGAPAPLLRTRNSELLNAELDRYGRQWAQEHPVA